MNRNELKGPSAVPVLLFAMLDIGKWLMITRIVADGALAIAKVIWS